MRLHILFIAAVSVFILVGCGVRGNLKTPPPIWGDKDKIQTEQATSETEDATEPADIEEDEDANYLEGPY